MPASPIVVKRYVLQQKCPKKPIGSPSYRNTMVQLSTSYTDPECYHTHRHTQTNRRTDDSIVPITDAVRSTKHRSINCEDGMVFPFLRVIIYTLIEL